MKYGVGTVLTCTRNFTGTITRARGNERYIEWSDSCDDAWYDVEDVGYIIGCYEMKMDVKEPKLLDEDLFTL